jgi:thiol-disulfide isomerase/thioredoxin
VSLASLRGSDVVIHFTAAWCPYCDAEIDAIGRMAESYASSGVKVMLVDIQDKDSGWESLEAKVAKSVILVRDATGDASRRYAPPKALPAFANRAEVMLAATVVVDKKGKIGAFELISTNPGGGFDPNLTPIRQNLDGRLASSGAPHVLDVAADKGEAAAGSGGELAVHIRIASDFHVMSNAPSKPTYVATVVELSGPSGVTFDKPRYPAAVSYRLSDTEISTFRGDFDVMVPFTVAASVPAGAQEIHGKVHYQACTESRCLFPRDAAFETTLNVATKP